MSETEREALAEVIGRRMDDWLRSTSETYADFGSEVWMTGLRGYLIDGPDALLPWLAQVKATARAEAWEEGWAAGARWQRAEEAAKRSFAPMPELPSNPYREIGGAQ